MTRRLALFLALSGFAFGQSPLVQKPYLQLGPDGSKLDELALMWQTADTDASWTVEYKSAGEEKWRKAGKPSHKTIAVRTVTPHRVYRTTLEKLAPGEPFHYRLLKDDKAIFEADGLARRTPTQDSRFVVFGDCAQDTPGQKAIAYQTSLLKPDFVLITGDIVYTRGRVSEYNQKFFPVYAAEQASPNTGAPLLSSTLFVGVVGNHDALAPDMDAYPDSLAYYYYWDQPLNGPLKTVGEASTPIMKGAEAAQKAFLKSAGKTYPQMANFSFDYGNAHWTVVDSNKYVDWSDPKLREWVEKDIRSAKDATWHFVAFHHPGFNSSEKHLHDQWMRGLADIFERNHVDVVFSGHVHNYQRTFPLLFKAGTYDPKTGNLPGEWKLDKEFDGVKNTKPSGVIYLVTGGGGATLYDPAQQDQPQTWLPFTDKFISNVHSLTQVDVSGKKLTIRQVSENGEEIDHFDVTK